MKPFVLGLTGGTGSGKSSLRPLFEKNGFIYIDTDILARKVMDPELPYLSRIYSVFGEDRVCKDGLLDRRALANLAFSSQVSTAVLNLMTHPAIIEMSLEIINRHKETGWFVIDAPLLFEAGMERICDAVLAVTAPKEKRIERIVLRDGITEEEASLRIARQRSDESYRECSDYIIENDSDSDTFLKKAEELISAMKVKYSGD